MEEEKKEVSEVKETEKKEVKAEGKKSFLNENTLEIITVILLGITALLTAWASYVGSIHGGNQATNYATSNNISSDGNSLYNAAVQNLSQDMGIWNTIASYEVEILYAESVKDNAAIEANVWKLQWFCEDNLPENMAAAIGYDVEKFNDGNNDTQEILEWLKDDKAITTPFTEEFVNKYFEEANTKLEEAEKVIEQGKQDNANGDKFSLVTVIYSVALFLLGIVGVFKNTTNKKLVLAVSVVCLIIAVIFMCTIPLPTSGGIFG
ncbi:MAG: hypothetical protein E7386_01050 [Ruminococcaceae bacterium]|nr:hypothetical protein [Oscillospiraceae bacterium]